MVFEDTNHNYFFIIGVWVFTVVLELILCTISHSDTTKENPAIATTVIIITRLAFFAYAGIIIAIITYDRLMKKLERTTKNYLLYILHSVVILSTVFVDLAIFVGMPIQFIREVVDPNSIDFKIIILQTVVAPLVSLSLVWLLRNHKVKWEKATSE